MSFNDYVLLEHAGLPLVLTLAVHLEFFMLSQLEPESFSRGWSWLNQVIQKCVFSLSPCLCIWNGIVENGSSRKYVISIAGNPFVCIYFLPELAWRKCKQTKFRAIFVQYCAIDNNECMYLVFSRPNYWWTL